MPIDTIESFAQQYNIPAQEVENYWAAAKEIAAKKYSETEEDYYPYVVGIVKNMINAGDPNAPQQEKTKVTYDKKKYNELKNQALRYYKDPSDPRIYEFIARRMREETDSDTEDTPERESSYLDTEPVEGFGGTFPIDPENDGAWDLDTEDTLQEFFIRDPSTHDKTRGWSFVWRSSSTPDKATAWVIVKDSAFEITFDLFRHGGGTWPAEWRYIAADRIGAGLHLSIDKLSANLNGMKISTGSNTIPSIFKEPLLHAVERVMTDYFSQFGKTLYSSIVFWADNKRDISIRSFYDELYKRLKSKFSNLKGNDDLADDMANQATPSGGAYSRRKYYVLTNTSGPRLKEEGGEGATTSANFGDSIPADQGRDRKKWKQDWDSQSEDKEQKDTINRPKPQKYPEKKKSKSSNKILERNDRVTRHDSDSYLIDVPLKEVERVIELLYRKGYMNGGYLVADSDRVIQVGFETFEIYGADVYNEVLALLEDEGIKYRTQ